MAKIYQIICVLLVLILLSVGTISLFDKDATFSETEGRDLNTFPKIKFSGLMDGGFFQELEMYYTDTFPFRENMLDTYRTLEGFYGYDSLNDGSE